MMEDAEDGDVRNPGEGNTDKGGRAGARRAMRLALAVGLILAGLFLVMAPVLAAHGVPVRDLLAAAAAAVVAWLALALALAVGSRR